MSLLLDEIDREKSPAKRRHDLQLCNPGVLTWWEEPSGLHLVLTNGKEGTTKEADANKPYSTTTDYWHRWVGGTLNTEGSMKMIIPSAWDNGQPNFEPNGMVNVRHKGFLLAQTISFCNGCRENNSI